MPVYRSLFLAILLVGMAACGSSAPAKSIAYEDPPVDPAHAEPTPAPVKADSPDRAAAEPALTPAIGGQIFTQVSVSQLTNCRSGPGVAYDFILSFLPGQTARLLGRDPSLKYLVINTPSGGTCWLWNEFATVTGNIEDIPILYGPALPTDAPTDAPVSPAVTNPTPVPPTSTPPPSQNQPGWWKWPWGGPPGRWKHQGGGGGG